MKSKSLQISEFLSNENGFYTVSNVVKVNEGKRDAFIKDIEKRHDALAIDRQQMNENFLGLLKRISIPYQLFLTGHYFNDYCVLQKF
jgi:hypothetical protein